MAELIVRRRAASQDQMCKYVVLVDGGERGRVGNDSEIRVHVEPGRHRVQLKVNWCRSPAVDVDVPGGGKQVLDCGPDTSPLTDYLDIFSLFYLFRIVFRPGHYLALRPGEHHAAVPDLRDRRPLSA
jgi:hypothetical protein